LNNTAEEFTTEINTGETKIMASKGNESVRGKICIDNRILEQVNTVNCLQYNISYKEEMNLNMKITNFVRVVRIINQVSKPSLGSRHTRIQICKTLARPTLSYKSKAGKIRRNDERSLISAEIHFMRRTTVHTLLGHKRNKRNYERITHSTNNRI
jgi:hypothetical protein